MAQAPINQEDILGSLIPDVYINGITLESSGTPLVESNPHIEHERENINKQKKPEVLVVTVDMSLKEKLDDSLISSWFAEQDFTKYLKLNLVQSTDARITKILTACKNTVDRTNFESNKIKDMVGHHEIVARELVGKNWKSKPSKLSKAIALYHDKTESRTLTVAHDVLGDGSSLTQHRSSIDSDGNSITDLTYRAKFYIPDVEPSHLAYFALSYIDMDQLIADFNLEAQMAHLSAMNGKTASDIVINNGELVSVSYVFQDSENKPYTGPTHKSETGQWMSKSSPQPNSVPLTRIRISNNKIQDFRDVKEIEKLQIDLAVFENELMSAKNRVKIRNNDNMMPKRKKTYFTDIHISRDPDGTARFTFGLDYKQYVQDNSLYGKLFENTSHSIRKEIYKNSRIRTLKVYRRRIKDVKTLNSLGSIWVGEVPFSNEETPVLVSVSGEKDYRNFKDKTSARGSLKEVDYAFNTSRDRQEIRSFSCLDKTSGTLTDGQYQYGIEIEVEDATFNFLSDQVDLLVENKKMLEKYLVEASKLGMTKVLVAVDDPHIDHESERMAELRSTSGNFDPIANRFTQAFGEKMKQRWTGQAGQAPWVKPAVDYLRVLHITTNSLSVVAPKMFKTFYTMANPVTGNPMGIMAMMALYDNLISKLARVLAQDSGTRTTRWTGENQGSTPQTAVRGKTSKTPTKTFRNTKWFTNSSFDSNIQKNAGMSYLWSGEKQKPFNRSGLKELSGAYYKARVNYETLRYFTSLKPSVNIQMGSTTFTDTDSIENTNYSFLSPSMVELPSRTLNLIAAAKTGKDPYNDYDYYSSVEGNMLAHSAGIGLGNNSTIDSGAEYSSTMTSFFSDLNATIMPVDEWEPIPMTDHLSNVLSSPQNVDGTFFQLPEPRPLDPVIEVHTVCKTEPTDDPKSNVNSVFRTLAESLVQTGGNAEGASAPPFKTTSSYGSVKIVVMNDWKDNESSTSGIEVEVDTKETYNLGNTSNAVSWMAQDPEIIASVLNSNGRSGTTPTITNALASLPNQVKSLFLASSNPTSVSKKWFSLNYDFVRDLRTSAAFRINYQLIKRVDVLVGYKRSNGKRMIREPIWEPLTQAHYQNSVGEGLLCRLKDYTNVKMGIIPPRGLTLPTYDEYFVLTPPRQDSLGADVGLLGAAGTGLLAEGLIDAFDAGFESDVAAYETASDVAPVEVTNSNFYDCGEVA